MDAKAEAYWRKFERGTPLGPWRRMMRILPANPRCRLCYTPFRGMGRVLRWGGYGRSQLNPDLCNACERAPLGGVEIDIGVLFADIREFTTWSEQRAPQEVASLLNRFYETSVDVLTAHDAYIDKLVGDEVMALFIPSIVRGDHRRAMAEASRDLLHAVGFGAGSEPWLPIGIGLDAGVAFVGVVGSEEAHQFTALGDVVNTAARLQSSAGPGQLIMSDAVHAGGKEVWPRAERTELTLKGKTSPVVAWRAGAA